MKKVLTALFAITLVITISSCSTDFDIAAPYKDISIVNGIFDIADSVHYVRIQKAFMDQNQAAYTMAQVADSSYYKDLTVTVKEINATSGNVISTTKLTKVDMGLTGNPKDTGTFFQQPNYGYQYTKVLTATNIYRLIIVNNTTGATDSASMVLLGKDFIIRDLQSVSYRLSFYNANIPAGSYSLTATYPVGTAIAQGVIRVKWVDVNTVTNTSTPRYADWVYFTSGDLGETHFAEMKVAHAEFYNFLLSAMGPAPTNVLRYMDKADVYTYAGGVELKNYRSFQQAGGLTSDQVHPNYTNFSSSNTLGIFTSRSVRIDTSIQYTDATIDRLKTYDLMQPLKIRGIKQ